MQEKKVETQAELSQAGDKRECPGVKTCKQCNCKFEITHKEIEFFKKFGVPETIICFECILKQMMSFWPSIGKWYSRKCDATQKNIVTNYSPDSRFPVYELEYFNGDKWTADFLELDINKTIFEQLKTLQEKVPRPHQLGNGNVNCNYCDDAWNSKNCYLSSSFLECENIYYSYRVLNCKDSSDLVFCWNSSLCNSLIFSRNCFNVSYSMFIEDSSESLFLYDCKNTKNCFMCWNLRNTEYCIKNKKYSKDDYFKELQKYDFGSRKQIEILQEEFNNHLKNDSLHPENWNISCENVLGNFLTNSKNLDNCTLIEEGENSINLFRGKGLINSMNLLSILEGEKCYNVNTSSNLYNVKFSSYCIRCSDSEYLDNCIDLKNCFACVGLKNKQYCILNKQYTKNEYEELLTKIKLKMWNDNEYGNFFPYSMMYTAYNNTISRIYFPETKENIEKLGGYWEDEEYFNINNEDIEKLSDNIIDIDDNPNGITTVCKITGKKFNYIKQVVDLHKKLNRPIFQIFHINRIVDSYKYLSFFKKQEGICFISGKKIVHYYPNEFGYKKIISNDEYNKLFF